MAYLGTLGRHDYLPTPLWSLSLYFCLWHARRHTRWVLACTKSPAEAKIWMLSIFSLTIIMGAAAYLLWLPTTAASTLTAQIFFIGIFALTVPHMILIDYYLGNLLRDRQSFV